LDTTSPTNGHDQCLDKWIEKTVCFYFHFTKKMNCAVQKKNASFSSVQCSSPVHGSCALMFSPVACNVSMDTYSTMNYRKVMTKLNENNVTYSMLYKLWLPWIILILVEKIEHILNGSQ